MDASVVAEFPFSAVFLALKFTEAEELSPHQGERLSKTESMSPIRKPTRVVTLRS